MHRMSLPRMQPRHPGSHRLAVALVFIPVALLQQRLLVPPDKRCHDRPDGKGVSAAMPSEPKIIAWPSTAATTPRYIGLRTKR